MVRIRRTRNLRETGTPFARPTDRVIAESRKNDPGVKVCAECFAPRSRYRTVPFCVKCERAVFKDEGYGVFLSNEAYRIAAARRRKAKH
jgi:hypothetical protein